jgi:CHAD domain-containing protein
MKGVRGQLSQPVELICRRLSAALLDDAGKACDRLGAADDPEALHDYRVGVRRLRSFIGAYRGHFPKAIGKKARKRLAKLICLTNAGRDNEVHVAWLGGQLHKASLSKSCRRGYEIALQRMTSDTSEAESSLVESARLAFQRVSDKLGKRLNEPQQAVRLDKNGQVLTFADATAAVLLDYATELKSKLASIQSIEDKEQSHRARLAAKRLRYVLEQVRSLVVGGRATVSKLKELQDFLGDLRDLQNIETEISRMTKKVAVESSRQLTDAAKRERSLAAVKQNGRGFEDCQALAAALIQIKHEQDRLYRSFSRRWTGENTGRFFVKVDRIIQQLAPEFAARPETQLAAVELASGGSENSDNISEA